MLRRSRGNVPVELLRHHLLRLPQFFERERHGSLVLLPVEKVAVVAVLVFVVTVVVDRESQ